MRFSQRTFYQLLLTFSVWPERGRTEVHKCEKGDFLSELSTSYFLPFLFGQKEAELRLINAKRAIFSANFLLATSDLFCLARKRQN